jgi:hypothetical protein
MHRLQNSVNEELSATGPNAVSTPVRTRGRSNEPEVRSRYDTVVFPRHRARAVPLLLPFGNRVFRD